MPSRSIARSFIQRGSLKKEAANSVDMNYLWRGEARQRDLRWRHCRRRKWSARRLEFHHLKGSTAAIRSKLALGVTTRTLKVLLRSVSAKVFSGAKSDSLLPSFRAQMLAQRGLLARTARGLRLKLAFLKGGRVWVRDLFINHQSWSH